jgi:hypothetical protein
VPTVLQGVLVTGKAADPNLFAVCALVAAMPKFRRSLPLVHELKEQIRGGIMYQVRAQCLVETMETTLLCVAAAA